MRIRTVISLIFSALAAVVVSCTKETEASLAPGAKKVAYIGISARNGGPSDIRASLGDDLKVAWEAGDDIFYYTGKYTSGASTSTRAEGSWKVPAPGAGATGPILSVKLPVEYSDGDNRVTVLTKGRALGTVEAANLNSLTVSGGVPASQDGKFASTYLAACEGNLLALAQSTDAAPNNLTMSCLQSYICFSLSDLTVGDRTVNKIEITGTSVDGGDAVCGNIAVTLSENGSTTHSVTAALSGTPGNKITIDKTGSKFTANEKIYVAVLPYAYNSLRLTLFNGDDKLASVPVRQKISDAKVDATQGKVVNIGEVNAHAKVTSTEDKFKMFPEKVAITSERTEKRLWLKIEPSDFNGKVVWSSSDNSIATVPQTGEIMENVSGIGKCISVTVTNKKAKTGGNTDNYNLDAEYPVIITAKVYDPVTEEEITTKTCEITVGDFLDLGTRAVDGKRCLWARHILRTNNNSVISAYDKSKPVEVAGDGSAGYALYPCAESYIDRQDNGRTHFGWGELGARAGINSSDYGRRDPMYFEWGTEYFYTKLKYSKYNSIDNLPYLQRAKGEFSSYGITGNLDTVDDVASKWNSACHMPMVSDVSALINNCDWDLESHTLTSRIPGFADCYMKIVNYCTETGDADEGGYMGSYLYLFWTAEYDYGFSGNAIQAIFHTDPPSLISDNKFRRSNVRPVKYVD